MGARRVATGYIVVRCGAQRCDTPCGDATMAALRECVRDGTHSVLVEAGCLCGGLRCEVRGTGAVLVVQPCDGELEPCGPATFVGPLTGYDDVVAVRQALSGGRFDVRRLPARLLALHRRAAAATRN